MAQRKRSGRLGTCDKRTSTGTLCVRLEWEDYGNRKSDPRTDRADGNKALKWPGKVQHSQGWRLRWSPRGQAKGRSLLICDLPDAGLSGKVSEVWRARTAGSSRGRSHTGLAPAPLAKCRFIFRSDYPHLEVRKLTFQSRLQMKILIKRLPIIQIPHLQVSINFPEGRADLRIPQGRLENPPAKHRSIPAKTGSYSIQLRSDYKGFFQGKPHKQHSG